MLGSAVGAKEIDILKETKVCLGIRVNLSNISEVEIGNIFIMR